jgi:hypothetical protein
VIRDPRLNDEQTLAKDDDVPPRSQDLKLEKNNG